VPAALESPRLGSHGRTDRGGCGAGGWLAGQPAEDALGGRLSGELGERDRVLQALYEGDRKGGLSASAPNVARWLGDIRSYFPTSVVRVMQRDAMERLGPRQMWLEPELLATVEAGVHLLATIVSLASIIPQRTRDTARAVDAQGRGRG
jgi:hypothetical protein